MRIKRPYEKLKSNNKFEPTTSPKDLKSNYYFEYYLLDKLPGKYYTMGIYDHQHIFYLPTKKYIHWSIDLPAAHHEIAHFVELSNINRLLLPDFDFSLGISSNNPKNAMAVYTRELRVRAIQRHMRVDYKEYKDIQHIQNEFIFKEMKDSLPFGRFKNEKELIDWSINLHDRTFNAWNKDRIEFEFNRRADFIRNWMETPDKVAA